MFNLEQLVFYASHINGSVDFQQLIASIDARSAWVQEDGFSYSVLVEPGVATSLQVSYEISELLLEHEVEVEVVRVEGEIPPHFHHQHDAVVICKGVQAPWHRAWDPWFHSGRGRWRSVHENQTLLLPKRAIHGFKCETTTVEVETFYLLVMNNVPFTEGDVTYVDTSD